MGGASDRGVIWPGICFHLLDRTKGKSLPPVHPWTGPALIRALYLISQAIQSAMDPILSSIVMQAGRHLVGNLMGADRSQPDRAQDSEARMARFEERLERAMDPVKADLKGFLESNRVGSIQGLEALDSRLMDGLAHSKEVTSVDLERGVPSQWDLVSESGMLRLENDRGDSIELDPDSALGMGARRLMQVRQLLDQSREAPGLPLGSLLDSMSAAPETVETDTAWRMEIR